MARLTPEQAKLAAQAHYGLIPRPPHSVVPAITRRDYGYILDRWSSFDPWRAWRDRGGPRPEGVWKLVPKWDGGYYTPFDLLLDIRTKWPLEPVYPNPQPVPVPPAGGAAWSLAPGQSWFVAADAYWNAVSGPNYFGRAFTADGNYPRPSRAEIALYHSRGTRTAAWGDSRPTGGTTTQQIVDVANELRVDAPMFQAESIRECSASLAMMDKLGGDGHLLIVNLTAIRDGGDAKVWADLTARIKRGNVLAIVECYKNCGWGGPDWLGLPAASTLGATYRDAECAGMDEETYYTNGWMAGHRDSWYTAAWTPDNYAAAR